MNRIAAVALSASLCLSLPVAVVVAQAQEKAQSTGEHAEEHHHEEGDHSHHEGEAAGVRTVHAWTRATSGAMALVFVDIQNKSDRDIAITGGKTEAAESVDLVGFQLKDGEPDYVVLPAVPIKAGAEMTLAPNGLALRLNGLKEELVLGTEHTIEIEFDFGHIAMFFQVEAADARTHSHVGHQHE